MRCKHRPNRYKRSDKAREKTQDGKPRPMKVIMKDPERKVRLHKKLWKLRDATESYMGLSIQNDLTKKEREEEKKLLVWYGIFIFS